MSQTKKDEALELLKKLSPEELQEVAVYVRERLPRHPLEKKWNIQWELILDAILRSQDITQRGVRGVIAEAVFEARILPHIAGWKGVPVHGDLAYDCKIESTSELNSQIRIQVKLQRMEKQQPLRGKGGYIPCDYFMVEVQKTRGGTDAEKKKTRPYRFGEFDVLAVNMQPSTQDWSKFMYTVGSWLIPRDDKNLIAVMQPVSSCPNDVWTDDISVCIDWFLSDEKKVIFDLPKAQREYAERKLVKREKKAAESKAKKETEKAARKAKREEEKAAKKAAEQPKPSLFDPQ